MNQNQEKISLQSLIGLIPDRSCSIDCTGLSGSERAYLVSRLYAEQRIPIFVIVSSPKEAERFLEDLRFFTGRLAPPIIYFPPYSIMPFKHSACQNETAAKRIGILYRLMVDRTPPLVVTTVEAVLQKLIPKQEICNYAELVVAGESIDRDLLIEKLISGGYVRSVIVEESGDFCIRGGILDVFSPLYSDPLRIELSGDMVDSLRFFSAASQRKIKNIQEAVILPARETILKKESIDRIASFLREQAPAFDIPATEVRDTIGRIRKDDRTLEIEGLIPIIYPEPDTFFDYIPDSALSVLIEPGNLAKRADELQEQAAKSYLAARNKIRLSVKPEALYLEWSEAKEVLERKRPLTIKMFPVLEGGRKREQASLRCDFSVEENTVMKAELKSHREGENLLLPVSDWIDNKKQSGYATLLVCSTASQADRLKSLLAPYGLQFESVDRFPGVKYGKGVIYICLGQVSSGFVWPAESLAIVTEDEIFGAKHRRKREFRQGVCTELLALDSLKKGDLVVHTEHGIGQYEGLIKLNLNRIINDFLLIVYRDNDKLYLPVDRMSMVQKYMGMNGIAPVLDKMGGKSWERIKKKVKKSVERIAGKLLKLYAERKIRKGYACKGIDSYFSNFEAGFPYEETADQLKAIEDVLHDMARPVPMDRLICGDTGYGKTEVVLRASFVAVNSGKQVAVLVPTTVLAQQHFTTFSDRFERYPVNIACLNRFRSLSEQRAIIDDLKGGKIDIVIGTHRLLQKDVAFKDLGLVVLDEEHRFGVKHKEKLKSIRSMVDVLALTATPIPRTLHMSLMGIRDISIISTPPEHRQAIITHVSEFDDTVISEAIRKELKRDGQIFFVHNNIHNIWKIARYLQELVPEVKLGVGHGRLREDELEQVMLQFVNKEIDMLVCTTIVGAGLDIPSANTVFVNRVDRFGLAQIYQLRGRVGRSDEQAYAYLFTPNEGALSRDAQKRLKVLMEHTDLGAGFQIAMSDLEIRGGGTVLGAAQSGHIAAVGYDMFLKLMENSISELKGEAVQEDLEPKIDIGISAFIPESFIPDIDQRLSAYRRLARMTELKEIADFKDELIDRFGVLPVEADNLLLKIMLKVLAIKAGVKQVDLTEERLILYLSEAHQKNPSGIVDMVVCNPGQFELTPDHILKARLSKENAGGPLVQSRNILKEIIRYGNS